MLRGEIFFGHQAVLATEEWASCDPRRDGRASFWQRKSIDWEPWRHVRMRIRQRLRPEKISTGGSGSPQEIHFRLVNRERKEEAKVPRPRPVLRVARSEASPALRLDLFLGPSRKWRRRNASCRD